MNKWITTSWDDGHPLDFKLADLLDKYALPGTFYIPRSNPQNAVMPEADVARLSRRFEVGGHTLNHVNLKACNSGQLEEEIGGSYRWLQDVTGVSPVSFCPPFGKFTSEALKVIFAAGFRNVRTTVLLSARPGLPVMDTTLQVFNHSAYTYAKHLSIRLKISDLLLWLRGGASSAYGKLADHYLDHIERHGGCFHLWGHSWEIDKFGLWGQLEELFKRMSAREGFTYAVNGKVGREVSPNVF
jgi:peptidoglycan-N-acetylglucosamine deacetylase